MRLLVLLLLGLMCVPANAQLTQSQINGIIATDLPSCGDSCVNANDLRQVLGLMNQATFQFTQFPNSYSASQTFQGILIAPTVSTTNQAIGITQVAPNGSGFLGNTNYNTINITTAANYGNGNVAAGIKITGAVGGINAQGSWWTSWSEAVVTGGQSNGDVIGGVSRCVYSGGTNSTVGGCYGSNPQGILTATSSLNSTNGEVAGSECDARIDTGSSAAWRFGCGAVSTGPVKGTLLDSAYEIGSASTPWGAALLLNDGHGGAPIDTSAALIAESSATAYTIHDLIALPTYTVSGGNILKLSNVTWTGAGVLTTATLVANGGAAPASGTSVVMFESGSVGYIDAAVWGSGAIPLYLQHNTAGPVFMGGVLGLTPATWTDTQTCTAGQVSVDASFVYVCTATNTVKRAALSSF
jgi:hypothetical protein